MIVVSNSIAFSEGMNGSGIISMMKKVWAMRFGDLPEMGQKSCEPIGDIFFGFLYSMQGQGFGVGKGDLLVCSETLHADLPAFSHSQAR